MALDGIKWQGWTGKVRIGLIDDPKFLPQPGSTIPAPHKVRLAGRLGYARVGSGTMVGT